MCGHMSPMMSFRPAPHTRTEQQFESSPTFSQPDGASLKLPALQSYLYLISGSTVVDPEQQDFAAPSIRQGMTTQVQDVGTPVKPLGASTAAVRRNYCAAPTR